MKLPSSPSLLRRGRRMTPIAILGCILFVAIGTQETAVFAQSACDTPASCTECLETEACDWYNGPGCLDNSVQIADITRYSIDDRDSSVEEVCQRASNDQADSRLCSSKTDCSSCVESVLSDSENTCQWVEDIGICQTECGMAGCGVTTCRDASVAKGRSPCSTKTSCEECVGATETDSGCAWVPVFFYESYPCTEMSCDLVADPKCYSRESSLDSGLTQTASEICGSPVEGEPEAVDPLPASSAAPCDIFAMLLFLVVLFFVLFHWDLLCDIVIEHHPKIMILLAILALALVYESHHKARFATLQPILTEEESLLSLHLQKIEQPLIQLRHENLNRLAKMGGEGNANPDDGTGENEVDINLIKQQTEQLYRMEQELSHEVDTLQKRTQRSARNHIIQEFGEGPVQVVLELDFGDAECISILLWRETPHAAWTWLEQIGNNVWDGAEFKWQQGHKIDAVPHKDSGDGTIEFVEHSQHEHIAWTVGVREQPNDGSGGGSLSMYINLEDNSQLHKHETCVGKVIDGFDTLQKLLWLSRNNGNGNQQDNSSLPILIRKATAEHYVTKKGGMGK